MAAKFSGQPTSEVTIRTLGVFLLAVNLCMYFQTCLEFGAIVAQTALERSLVGVRLFVAVDVPQGAGSEIALVALVGLFTRMCSFVNVHTVLRGRRVIAPVAFVGLFARVCSLVRF